MTIINCNDIDVINYIINLWNPYPFTQYNKFKIIRIIINIILNILSYFYYLFVSKESIINNIQNNILNIKKTNIELYYNDHLEKKLFKIKTVTYNDILFVYRYLNSNSYNRKNILCEPYNHAHIFPKYKSGDRTQPEHFRYMVQHHKYIKILDKIWCHQVITLCDNNLPDKDIFKTNITYSCNNNIINIAINNTTSMQDVVLLDITQAYDSLHWDILENLLLSNLTRKINTLYAYYLVNFYMTLIDNRILFYNNIIIPAHKGIPTGLPSSVIVFTLALEEIIFRWMEQYDFKQYYDFILNIYVDDIYIKIINYSKTDLIINSLIDQLKEYKLFINIKKSKADINLNLDIDQLTPKDLYLGIPFTREVHLYGQIILQNFYDKHKIKINWAEIYKILITNTNKKKKRKLVGFLNYKLKPLLLNSNISISKYIYKNYIIS